MPKDMFGDVVDPSIKMGNKMWYTVPLTMLLQATVVAALVIVPLMATGMMPTPPSMMAFVAAVFFVISMFFVHRSFYGMRIES